jgi:thymidylate synthase (FAD)
MKVEIINPEQVADLYKNHGEFACTCYDTPKNYAERVGKSCSETNHRSGSRCEYIKFEITGDRGTLEQFMRHEIGVRYDEIDKYQYQDRIDLVLDVNPCNVVKNMQSFRYVLMDDFDYTIPDELNTCPEALGIYKLTMLRINDDRKAIRELLEERGIDSARSVEIANFLLPRATNLVLTIGFTPEALIQFMWKRLCKRAQPEAQKLARLMKEAVKNIHAEFAKELKPQCQHYLWCPEKGRSCGAAPTKEELREELMRLKGLEK